MKINSQLRLTSIVCLLLMLCSCKGKKGSSDFPDDFNSRTDTEKVAYMMEAVGPDSVARFICQASLGKIEGIKLDSMSMAVLYAYENYRDNDAQTLFGETMDSMQNSFPLADKMELMRKVGSEDPMGLGLRLGLEYIEQIREQQISVDRAIREIRAFKEACGDDEETYKRFLTGMKVALKENGSKDLPDGVYTKLMNIAQQ